MRVNRRGCILAVKNYSLSGKIISYFSGGLYNHIAIFDDNYNIIEALPGGVRKIGIDYYIEEYKNKKCEMAVFEVYNINEQQIDDMLEFCNSKIGLKYDFIQIFWIYLTLSFKFNSKLRGFEHKDLYICSELIAEAAYESGLVFNENKNVNAITPADITNSKIVRKIQEWVQ